MLRKDGTSFPVTQQDVYFFSSDNVMKYGFCLVTDISHLKSRSKLMMSILNTEDETNQVFTCITEDDSFKIKETTTVLSLRERQILMKD